MAAPGLDAVSGALIGPSATPILCAGVFATPGTTPGKADTVIADAQALIMEATLVRTSCASEGLRRVGKVGRVALPLRPRWAGAARAA